MSAGRYKRTVVSFKNYIVVVAVPLLLLPIVIYFNDLKGRCGYMMFLMAIYWVTEVIPLPATGLIPIFLAPLFGLLTSTQVASAYMKDVLVMMVGGIFVALAIERSNLHTRIALSVLRIIGTTPRWLMLGFMLPTFLCSMFISNTATTAMMLPIMEAVLQQLRATPGGIVDPNQPQEEGEEGEESGQDNEGLDSSDLDVKIVENGGAQSVAMRQLNGVLISDVPKEPGSAATCVEISREEETTCVSVTAGRDDESPYFKRIAKGMSLAICYSSNIGGTATLTGTNPNMIVKGQADILWRSHGFGESPITYSSWLPYGLPAAVFNFIIMYLWLVIFYLGWRALKCSGKNNPARVAAVKAVITEEIKKLGPLRYAEVATAALFVILVLLWFFRNPGFITGWNVYFEEGYVSDAVAAMLVTTLLFCVPMLLPTPWREDQSQEPVPALLAWQDIHEKFPWGIVFLMGGGFALAECAQTSGLSALIGAELVVFGRLNEWLMISVICFLVAMLTEVTSNSATCTILMPIMAALAENLGYNPLYLMLPTAISTSYAFMLPVATPPNAIAFSYGRISVIDMMKGGAILNFTCVIIVTLATQTWGFGFFHFGEAPWASGSSGGLGNGTMGGNSTHWANGTAIM